MRVTQTRKLGDLEPGDRAVVRKVSGEPELLRRLMELGFVPGTTITLVRRAPMGDPIELRLRGTHFSIRNSEADRIDVDPF
jgi:ferrous iron transport protein A